jgi:hypothetical protein
MDYYFNQGMFILVYNNLEPFNLIVNKNIDIILVLD